MASVGGARRFRGSGVLEDVQAGNLSPADTQAPGTGICLATVSGGGVAPPGRAVSDQRDCGSCSASFLS